MNKIEKIIVHCSDSSFGTAITIDGWHRARVPPFSKIGYMGVILNGWVKPDFYDPFSDGVWEWGRVVDNDKWIEPDEVGAQALGLNSKTVGICLIGKLTKDFTEAQFREAHARINRLLIQWDLKVSDVLGHYEVDHAGKTCPNCNMDTFRKFLSLDLHSSTDQIAVEEFFHKEKETK